MTETIDVDKTLNPYRSYGIGMLAFAGIIWAGTWIINACWANKCDVSLPLMPVILFVAIVGLYAYTYKA